MFQLQKINQQTSTDAAQTEEQKKPENTDLTGWLISATWSGDVEQAGRKLEFDLAYTTRDKAWQNPELELGDEVLLQCIDDTSQQTFHLFQGRIFGRSRESGSSVMHFTAFDNIVYLAKSRITRSTRMSRWPMPSAKPSMIFPFLPGLFRICPSSVISSPMTSRPQKPSSRHYPISPPRTRRATTST